MKRYILPKEKKCLRDFQIKYKNAVDLAKEIDLKNNERYDCVVEGNFIFGDFLEAFIVENNFHVKTLNIQTLSYSENNIDSLKNIIDGQYLENGKLNVIVSSYFYSHERFNLIKYMYDELDINNMLQVAVTRSHCKVTLIETFCGLKIVVHGSANLRSSDNIEQFTVEKNESLFNFHLSLQEEILNKYKTINRQWQKQEVKKEGKPKTKKQVKAKNQMQKNEKENKVEKNSITMEKF